MTSGKLSDTSSSPTAYYHPLPTTPHPQSQPQYVIVLPRYYDPTSYLRRIWRRRLICLAIFLLLAGAIYLLWPSDPDVSIVRLSLKRFKIHTFPKISLDTTLDLTVKVRNRDFYSIDYNSLIVAIGYRGKQLGYVTSKHGHLRARGSSYINATLELDGVQILADVIPLLEDLAKGEIIFDTVTKIGGELGLFLFELPLEAKVACEINVNIQNQTIERQNCYPE